MADDLSRLHQWADGLLQNLSPAARRQLAREIAQRLRASQQQRIAAQQNPDGSAYAPRLRQKVGKLRKGKMFAKLRTARFLRNTVNDSAAVVGFAGRVDRIARVHQYGLRDRVRPGGPEVDYAQRELLGYTEHDVQMVEDVVLAHLAR
ncbi:phage virion morphogenesis protein [Crenobacter sp. SG2305]|uniref:phage virion morphogenesis protein n=1 Tax=Crenobacter oryzisoli TaxID=3056844 RepID=UPI0025AB3366|nr:phage virion morphogenesis protein [Crenobacter sp. SG2305]MDN0081610.1 phage virion morphogenesis protein [Crenobacter sp. SG2305]